MAIQSMKCCQGLLKLIPLAVVLSGLMPLLGQTNPAKEYIRLGDRVIAIENSPASSGAVSFGTPTSGTSLVVGSGTGSVTVNSTLGSGQSWSVSSNANWFHLNSGSSGTGNTGGTVQYSWDANSGIARSATLTLNPGTVLLQFNQAGTAGTLTLLPTSATLNSRASNQTVQVSSNANWTAAVTSPNSSWLTLTTANGTAPTSTLAYSVADNNTGAQRVGTITVTAGSNQQTFTVTQTAIQSLTVGPVSVVVPFNAQYVFTAYVDGTAVPASSVSWSVQIISGQAGTLPQPGTYLAPSVNSNNYVKATYAGFTSNFATVQVVSNIAGPTVESFTPTGTGDGATFSLVTKDPTGVDNDLQYVEFGFAQNINAPTQNGDCALMAGPYVPQSPAFVNYLGISPGVNFPNPTAPNLHSNMGVNCDVIISQATTTRNDPTNEITFNLPTFFHIGTASASKTMWVIPVSRHGLGSSTPVSFGTYVITGAAAVGPVSPQGGIGPSQIFTSTYTKGANATSLKSAEVLINSTTNTAAACDVRYDNVAHLFYLRNDAGTGWTAGIAQGSSQTIQNSQCSFTGTNSTASVVGSVLTVVANVTFTTSFFGARFVYLEAVDSNNADSGYQQQGYWTVDQPPTTVSVTPSSGSGSSQLFNFTYSDVNGAADLTDLKAMVNTSSTLGGCAIWYSHSVNGFYLYNSGTWLGPYVPGSANSPSGSSCTLNVAQSSVTYPNSGNIVTVNASLSFPTAFAGLKNVYLDALDAESKEATFGTSFGTFTVAQTIPIVLTTLPSGLSLSADGGGNCTAPCTFQWVPGSAHTITASTTPQSGGTGIQYVWANWSDSGTASHQITVAASAATYTANFTTQYYLTTSASPAAGGAISPVSGWYNSGGVVSVSATANGGYQFSGFSGAITGITTPQNVTVTGAASVTASYAIIGGSWYNASWSNRKSITIDHTKVSGSSNLTNFPVLISVTDANLKTVANGGSVGKTDGTDILFTTSDGMTKLNHELESYSPSTGQVIAWVQMPSLSDSADTVVYTYYGNASAANQQNPTGVWDSNYKGVYHLTNGTTLSAADSTSNGNTGTITGAVATAGLMDGGGSFNSTNGDNVSVNGLFGSPTQATLEAWVNLSSHGTSGGQVINVGQGLQIFVDSPDGGGSIEGLYHNGGYSQFAALATIQGQGWQHVAFTVNPSASSEVLYLNGIPVATGSVSNAIDYPAAVSTIGINPWWNTYNFGGKIDEARVSSIARSSDWILTEYRNQNSPSTFLSEGSQQSQGGGSQAATPTFTPVAGSYTGVQHVAISTTTSGASIRYTTDGVTTPTETVGTLYTGSVPVTSTTTIKAIAYSAGMTDSTVASATYTISGGVPAWYSSSWSNRKSITIDHTKVSGSSNLTNFPVLISVTDANLKTVANGGSVGKTDGTDMLFTASDGVTKLNHELESYNPSTGQVIAWVQVPSLSYSADTVVYTYYGNASAADQQNKTGTWDSNYKGVYHLTNGTTLSAADSTSNGNTGTITGAVATAGLMDGGGSFNSTNGDNVSVNGLFGSPTQATLEAWVNLSSHGTSGGQVINVGQGLQIFVDSPDGGGSIEGLYHNGGYSQFAALATIQGQGWQHVAFTVNPSASSEVLYLNGIPVATGSVSNAIDYPAAVSTIGINPWWNTYNFGGKIDEARVSSIARSSDWILTEYRNQNSPSTFCSVGAQQ